LQVASICYYPQAASLGIFFVCMGLFDIFCMLCVETATEITVSLWFFEKSKLICKKSNLSLVYVNSFCIMKSKNIISLWFFEKSFVK